jgi:predicted metal-dependent hydrolase
VTANRERQEFKGTVREWADALDVDVRSITIRSMANKWASCSTAGNVTFNAELLELDPDLQTYVIVHELLHFRIPNHGRLWKSLMHAHLGDYEPLEDRLKQVAGAPQVPNPAFAQ